MNKLFNPENPVMRLLTFLCDMMYINLLFLLTSLPLFTIGASLTAMYSVLFKRIRNEDPSIAKAYFSAFKQNFKQSTLFWLPSSFLIVFLSIDVYIAHNHIGDSLSFLQYPIAILIFIILAIIIYIFPQLAAFDTPSKQVLKNAALLSLANFPTTIFVFAVHIFLILLADLSATMLFIVLSIMMFLGIATMYYFFTLFFRRIFNKLIGGEEDAV